MPKKDLEVPPHTYAYAGAGALFLGGLTAVGLGDFANTVSASIGGALSGACLGLFF